MSVSKHKTLTTGQVARYCDVAPITVVRWIELGKLKGHRFPQGGHRRVLVEDFLAFLDANGLPLPADFRSGLPRVLVVEDESTVAMEIEEALEAAGYETRVASSGFEAGQLVGTFKPDVMTLDLRMPGLSGLAVLRSLRANSQLQHIKVLVISAMPSADLEEALAAGADEAVRKPVAGAEVVQRVKRLIGEVPGHEEPRSGADEQRSLGNVG